MTTEIRAILDDALRLRALGLSVIPVRGQDKRPLVPWKAFQTRRAKEAEITSWYRRWPDAGVAIVCGHVSGIAVVDCDPRNGDGMVALADRLPLTPSVETGGGGRHYYFALPPGACISKIPGLLPGVDLQAEASCVIAPPSLHPSGRAYRWLPGLAPGEAPLASLPLIIRQLIVLHHQRSEEKQNNTRKLSGSALALDAVLSALRGVRRCGRGWIARCPAHDDQVQSLSVGQGAEGHVLLFCHAGCSFTEILAVLRREAA